jgi:hypothetical protein
MLYASKDIDNQIESDKRLEIQMRQKAREMEIIARQKYEAEAGNAFKNYYDMQAVPICGDYLHSIALARLNTNA